MVSFQPCIAFKATVSEWLSQKLSLSCEFKFQQFILEGIPVNKVGEVETIVN